MFEVRPVQRDGRPCEGLVSHGEPTLTALAPFPGPMPRSLVFRRCVTSRRHPSRIADPDTNHLYTARPGPAMTYRSVLPSIGATGRLQSERWPPSRGARSLGRTWWSSPPIMARSNPWARTSRSSVAPYGILASIARLLALKITPTGVPRQRAHERCIMSADALPNTTRRDNT